MHEQKVVIDFVTPPVTHRRKQSPYFSISYQSKLLGRSIKKDVHHLINRAQLAANEKSIRGVSIYITAPALKQLFAK